MTGQIALIGMHTPPKQMVPLMFFACAGCASVFVNIGRARLKLAEFAQARWRRQDGACDELCGPGVVLQRPRSRREAEI